VSTVWWIWILASKFTFLFINCYNSLPDGKENPGLVTTDIRVHETILRITENYFTNTNGYSRNSSVVYRWATVWMIRGSSPGRGWEFLSSPPRPDRFWGPPSLLSNGYQGGLFPWGVKRSEHEADHSSPSSAEVKMRGAIPPLLQYTLMAWCSVKAQS
jgi:hypothetical protein